MRGDGQEYARGFGGGDKMDKSVADDGAPYGRQARAHWEEAQPGGLRLWGGPVLFWKWPGRGFRATGEPGCIMGEHAARKG